MHQECLEKNLVGNGAVWQSKYLLKDKLMTVPCKCLQIHYWNESHFFGLILSETKSQTSDTIACVCVCFRILSKQNNMGAKQQRKVGKSLNHFLEIFKPSLVCYYDQLFPVGKWFKICIEKTPSPIIGVLSERELCNVSFLLHHHVSRDLCVIQLMGGLWRSIKY